MALAQLDGVKSLAGSRGLDRRGRRRVTRCGYAASASEVPRSKEELIDARVAGATRCTRFRRRQTVPRLRFLCRSFRTRRGIAAAYNATRACLSKPRAPTRLLTPAVSTGHFFWLLFFGPAKKSDSDAGRRSKARGRRARSRRSKQGDSTADAPREHPSPHPSPLPGGERAAKRERKSHPGASNASRSP